VVYVYQGTVDQGPMFFERLHPDAVAIADPDAELFERFGIERGGLRAMFGARAWRAGLRAVREGHMINRKIGDPWTMPTVVAVDDGHIVWEHRGDHPGDHPDVADIPRLVGAT
jgi:hypothetical protein